MKYLLDQEELDALVKRSEVEARDTALELLRREIVSDEECEDTREMGHCGSCPLALLQWRSKIDSVVAKLMCNRDQEFSQ